MNVLVLNCYSRNALAVINGLGSSFNIIGAADKPAKSTLFNPDHLFHSPLLAQVERHTPSSVDERQFISDIAGICKSTIYRPSFLPAPLRRMHYHAAKRQ